MALKIQSSLGPELERLAETVVDCVFAVHSALGPGLLESVYEACLAWELRSRGLKVERQVLLPIVYKGCQLDDGLRLDLVVEDRIILEVKAVRQMEPVYRAQLLTYLRLSNRRLGFLINFHSIMIRDGIDRLVN